MDESTTPASASDEQLELLERFRRRLRAVAVAPVPLFPMLATDKGATRVAVLGEGDELTIGVWFDTELEVVHARFLNADDAEFAAMFAEHYIDAAKEARDEAQRRLEEAEIALADARDYFVETQSLYAAVFAQTAARTAALLSGSP